MRRVILFLFSLMLFVTGCAKLTVEKYSEYIPEKTLTIQVDSSLTDWWGPLKLKLRDKMIGGIKERLRKSRLYLVEKDADITIIIADIITAGKADKIQIEEVVLLVRDKKEQIFKIKYKQRLVKFPNEWYKVWAYAKGAKWITRILANRVVHELKARKISFPVRVSAKKQQPFSRGFIIYQPPQ